MAKGFVGGFIKREGRWLGQWIQIQPSKKKRRLLLEEARAELARQLGDYCGGVAIARRNMILVDALCPNGRELLEAFFAAARGESST